MIQRMAILSCFILIYCSCENNDDVIPNMPENPVDTMTMDTMIIEEPMDTIPIDPDPSTLIVGDSSYVYNISIDTMLFAPVDDKYQIDIDLDDIPDFEISSYFDESGASDAYYRFTFSCLNSESFYTAIFTLDTVFWQLDTVTLINSNNNHTNIWYNHQRSCNTENFRIDSILGIINRPHITPLVEGDILSFSDVWISGEEDFVKIVGSSPPIEMEINSDTTILQFYLFDTCFAFPEDQIRYIGIKKVVDGVEKLGWIKIRPYSVYTVILETAIQY